MGRYQVVPSAWLSSPSQAGMASGKRALSPGPSSAWSEPGSGRKGRCCHLSLLEQEDEEQCQTHFQPH